jgi:hypothetical protein
MLDLKVKTFTNLDPEIPITLINTLVILIYSILLNLKKKKIRIVIRIN